MQYRSYLGLVFADFVLSHYLSSTFESEPFNLFKVVVLSEIKLFFSKKDISINISGQDSGLNSTLIFRVPDTDVYSTGTDHFATILKVHFKSTPGIYSGFYTMRVSLCSF